MTPPSHTVETVQNLPRQEEDKALRPARLKSFVGQETACDNLTVFIDAAKKRAEALDHVLLSGAPGLGKTTMAQIIAREMGVGFHATSGPVITKSGDLAALLTNIESRDIIFIDEIHRLPPTVEEVLYAAMEDFQLDIMIGQGPSARSVKIDLVPFTLVGATTRSGLLSTPLRDRFGIPVRLTFYEDAMLTSILHRAAKTFHITLDQDGALEIAQRARGTPRVAIHLLKRIRDFAMSTQETSISRPLVQRALARLEIDKQGLNNLDLTYLKALALKYGGGPVGIETMAACIGETRDVLEETVEPYLIQLGFIERTARGRLLTANAFTHLGLQAPHHTATATFNLEEKNSPRHKPGHDDTIQGET